MACGVELVWGGGVLSRSTFSVWLVPQNAFEKKKKLWWPWFLAPGCMRDNSSLVLAWHVGSSGVLHILLNTDRSCIFVGTEQKRIEGSSRWVCEHHKTDLVWNVRSLCVYFWIRVLKWRSTWIVLQNGTFRRYCFYGEIKEILKLRKGICFGTLPKQHFH